MNNPATSKEEIIKVSRSMLIDSSNTPWSMRGVAIGCGIAVGSIYNYFPNKADLLQETILSIWEEIFAAFGERKESESFLDCFSCLYDTILWGEETYKGFFSIHALHFAVEDREKGKEMMGNYFGRLKAILLQVLEREQGLSPHCFTQDLSREQFVDYAFILLLYVLMQPHPQKQALLEMISLCLYGSH